MFAWCYPSATAGNNVKGEIEHEPSGEDNDAEGKLFLESLRGNGVLTEDTLEKLATMKGDLQGVEAGVAEVEDLVTGLEASSMDVARLGELKTVMTLFEARASELLLQGDRAGLSKELKDEQRKRLNALFTRIENIFNTIKQQQIQTGSVRSVRSNASKPVSSEKPPTTSVRPPTASEKPPTTSVKPPLASEKPPTTSVRPPTASEKPPTTSVRPPTASEKPPTTSVKPPLASEKPPTTSVKPPLASEKPAVHSERKKFASVGHKFSVISEEALMKLANTQNDLTGIESRVAELVNLLTGPGVDSIDSRRMAEMKTELAMLEAKADQLECKGIDDVYTGDLVSGKDAAKEEKKNQLQRLELLFNQLEQGFTIIKERQAVLRESGSH